MGARRQKAVARILTGSEARRMTHKLVHAEWFLYKWIVQVGFYLVQLIPNVNITSRMSWWILCATRPNSWQKKFIFTECLKHLMWIVDVGHKNNTLPISIVSFQVEIWKNYTGHKKFRHCLWCLWQISGMYIVHWPPVLLNQGDTGELKYIRLVWIHFPHLSKTFWVFLNYHLCPDLSVTQSLRFPTLSTCHALHHQVPGSFLPSF